MSVTQSTLRISLLEDVTARAAPIFRTLDRLQNQQMKAFAPMNGIISQAVALSASYFGATRGIDATAGSAIKFETAFADVKKVVDATDEQFENMRRTIRQMSGEVPLAANDIAALFAAAGESGIATEDLTTFAQMAARVGVAFDIGAGQAGESLAKLKTQLGLNVAETGDMADAINHLSNNMASKAKDITEFMLRVGAIGEMGGFVKEDIAAMGSAMIAAGSDASTAGTALKNVVRALTKGEFAKKSQRDAAKALGLHLPSIAKDMQKDAKGTMRTVLTAIAKAPKHQQTSLLSEFFGDEATAFMPLVAKIDLLDSALASVADRTKYAGSAFNEYVQRANTTQNVLDLLGNKISNVFSEMGDQMLPSIREGAQAIGYVIDTLDSRVSILDQVSAGMQGLTKGLRYDGGVRELTEDLGDLLFGKIDPAAGDQLGRIFMQAKDWGASIRDLNDAIRDNPLAKFLGEMSGYGFKLFVYGTGIAFLAGTVRKLAAAMMLLSGASTLISIVKATSSLASIISNPSAPVGSVSNTTAAAGGAAFARFAAMLKGFARIGVIGTASAGAWEFGKASYTGDTFYKQGKSLIPGPEDALHAIGSFFASIPESQRMSPQVSAQMAMDGANAARRYGIGGSTTETLPGKTADDIITTRIDAASLSEMIKPSGTQDVRVTNQQPVTVSVHNQISVTGVSDPMAAGSTVADQVGEKVRQGVESSFSD